ncbi:hypothetical protein OTU49_001644 [Cherax quadricarinatus]|uniref:Uncharacterized protein n=1 Tax=Cherax quadricarinatus TaxID=27406 RepID=A0AAW0XRY6_CHEQU
MCEENILTGVQFLMSEGKLQKFLAEELIQPEDLLREEKADIMNVRVNEEHSTAIAEDTQQEDIVEVAEVEGTNGGYFDLLPVSQCCLSSERSKYCLVKS